MRTVMLIAVVCVLQPRVAPAQAVLPPPDSLARYFRFDDPPPLACLLTYFPPFFIQHEIDMKRFVRSRALARIRRACGDLRAVDAVYIRAMQLTDNNTAMALLIATFACFDHRTVGLRIPLFSLFFPLTDESEEEFVRRVANLPSRLYSDTPPGAAGDRDKLQHFFGSAFFTFIFESRDAADRVGEFIENGEEVFIVGGVNDERDRRANHHGQDFGLALLDDNHRLPSEFFHPSAQDTLPAAGEIPPPRSTCTGVR